MQKSKLSGSKKSIAKCNALFSDKTLLMIADKKQMKMKEFLAVPITKNLQFQVEILPLQCYIVECLF